MLACGRDIPGKRLKLRQLTCHRLVPEKTQRSLRKVAINPTIPLLHSLTPVAQKNRSRYGNTTAVIPKILSLTCLEKGGAPIRRELVALGSFADKVLKPQRGEIPGSIPNVALVEIDLVLSQRCPILRAEDDVQKDVGQGLWHGSALLGPGISPRWATP